MRLSGLSMRSSQGSLNESHLGAPATHPYRDKQGRQEHSPEMIGGYVSPASTASPGTSPHVRQVKDSPPSVLRSESIYDCNPVSDCYPRPCIGCSTDTYKLSQVPENEEMVTRRGSIQAHEPLPSIYVQNPLEPLGPYPSPPSETGTSAVQPGVQQQHYPHGGSFIPPSSFSQSGESSFIPSASTEPLYRQQQSSQLQYSPEGAFQGATNAMGIPTANMSRYAPSTNEFTYAAGHGQEPFPSLT